MNTIRCILKDNQGATFIWVICFMVVVFIIGTSVLAASSMSIGVASRYRDSKGSYYYAKTLSRAITKDIERHTTDTDLNDPWTKIAQSVYDAKAEDQARTVVLNNVDIDVNLSALGTDINQMAEVTANIILSNQSMSVIVHYDPPREEYGVPGEDGYEPPKPEQPELAKVRFNMAIELKTRYRGQDYVIYLKYVCNGDTEGTPGMGAGSGVIKNRTYEYLRASDQAE